MSTDIIPPCPDCGSETYNRIVTITSSHEEIVTPLGSTDYPLDPELFYNPWTCNRGHLYTGQSVDLTRILTDDLAASYGGMRP